MSKEGEKKGRRNKWRRGRERVDEDTIRHCTCITIIKALLEY